MKSGERRVVARLVDLVDDRKEAWNALHLVEDDGSASRLSADEISQPLRPGRELPLDLRPAGPPY